MRDDLSTLKQWKVKLHMNPFQQNLKILVLVVTGTRFWRIRGFNVLKLLIIDYSILSILIGCGKGSAISALSLELQILWMLLLTLP